jgi:ketosteroid isomerase-like protein
VRDVDAAGVIDELSRVFNSRDWRAMRALYHRDALVFTVTGGPDPLTGDEVVAELERASADFVYFVTGSQPMALDEHAAIVTGRIRRRMPQGGFEDAAHVWLLTVRDGLIYRQGVYRDPGEAADAYELLGVDLGVSDPD